MRSTASTWLGRSLACGVVSGAFGIAAAQAQIVSVGTPPDSNFGTLGIARGQAARLSAVLVGNPDLYPPGPCRVALRFASAGGDTLLGADGAPVMREASLVPGRAVSLELSSADALSDRTRLRRQVRPVLAVLSEADAPPDPCRNLAATAEVFDESSGETMAMEGLNLRLVAPPEPDRGLTPPPDPDFGLLGLARTQTARLSAVVTRDPDLVSPGPCSVALSFVDAAGRPYVDAKGEPIAAEASLVPGAATWIDLPAVQKSQKLRRAFRAVLVAQPEPDAPPDPCRSLAGTVEIIDDKDGRTTTVYALKLRPGTAAPAVGGQ
jgi:hypothetical protein